ncbi:hypothetical protein Zmor_014382 [Zophobas morio]|uniref:Uncharacterized protein n=1 Tax=Zophobas morio TaxID=2755281 RepID=A0AA38IHA8_9CUCU|nr:hypothetical protein Zmor_014382 [Zophobas morio]
MSNCNAVSNPIIKDNDTEKSPRDQDFPYRQVIGALMFLMCVSRPIFSGLNKGMVVTSALVDQHQGYQPILGCNFYCSVKSEIMWIKRRLTEPGQLKETPTL